MDNGKLIIVGITVVVFAGIVMFANTRMTTEDQAAISIEGLQTYTRADRSHTNRTVDYELAPPAGGPHNPTWLDCTGTAYEDPVENERAVHALEHGAVWISYNSDVGTSTIESLEDYLSNYSFLSLVPEQDSPIKLTAWGNQLSVDSADDPRIDTFLEKFRQGPQTPEPGATCSAPHGQTM